MHEAGGYVEPPEMVNVVHRTQSGNLPDPYDPTPIKQDKFTPGMHIPEKPYSAFTENPPQTALLFAWNHKAEIMEKEKAFTAAGGKWLTHIEKD